MDNKALTRREASRDALHRASRAFWDWRAGCHKSGLSGSGRGGWCPSKKGLAAYFIFLKRLPACPDAVPDPHPLAAAAVRRPLRPRLRLRFQKPEASRR